jgi:hypothetical protein
MKSERSPPAFWDRGESSVRGSELFFCQYFTAENASKPLSHRLAGKAEGGRRFVG